MRSIHIKKLVITAVLAALMIVLQLTGIGIIPIPPAGVTIQHLPVIVGTMVCGVYAGLFLGGVFGVLSMMMAYATAMPLSVCFMDPFVAVLPRLLIPVAVWLAAKAFKPGRVMLKSTVCAIGGSLANTVFTLLSLYLIYGNAFADSMNVSRDKLLGATLTLGAVSGLPEAAVAALLTAAVIKALASMGIYKEEA